MLTKEDLLKITNWEYGGFFTLYCPALRCEIECETHLGQESDITPKVMKTINEFFSLSEEEYDHIEEAIVKLYDHRYYDDYPSELEMISTNYPEVKASNFLEQCIQRDWIQLELPWQGLHNFKNNYVKISFYGPFDDQGKHVVYENGKLKTVYIANEGDQLRTDIFT